MTGLLRIALPERELTIRVRLRTDVAPDTCALMSTISSTEEPILARHAIFSGRQVGFHLPAEVFADVTAARQVRPEYLTAFPAPGDVLWQYCPAGVLGPDEVFDLAVCYGPDARILMPWGFSPANRFGTVLQEDLQHLQELGEVCASDGYQRATVAAE
jgi:hypothetical protein